MYKRLSEDEIAHAQEKAERRYKAESLDAHPRNVENLLWRIVVVLEKPSLWQRIIRKIRR